MGAVKKVGWSKEIIPSLDQLKSIQIVRKIILAIRDTKENQEQIDTGRQHWWRINYYRRSKTLTAIFDPIDKYHTSSRYSLSAFHVYGQRLLSLWGEEYDTPEEFAGVLHKRVQSSEDEPLKLWFLGSESDWIFKGIHYAITGPYSEEQARLLVLEEFDKERKHFERLKQKFDTSTSEDTSSSRPRIPEQVRIEVWRRDGGKCARCGSREKLEYDHIIPLSKGGSNTARNIELLCEVCNKAKGANVA